MGQIIDNGFVLNLWTEDDFNTPDWYKQNGITLDEMVDI